MKGTAGSDLMQRTLLGDIVDRALESAWLAALVAVPALMNVYSERTFEGDKVPFLRSLALLALAVYAVRRIERAGAGTLGRQPVVVAAGAVVVVTLLANAFSIAPEISFWGAYERLQGSYTLLAYAAFFFLFIAVAGRAQVDRLVSAALVAALVPSLYALIQALGVDPIAWGAEVVGRAHGTAGNPIFLGAFLILVVPLSLARLLGAIEGGRAGAAVVYLALLVLQVVALACAQSRGPAVALGLGLGVFVLGAVVQRRFRRAAYAAGIVVVVAAAAAVCVRMLPPRWDAGQVMDLGGGNAQVRLLIWQGTASLIAAEPSRLLLGYGPDTFRFVFPPFFPPELARVEKSDVTPDRAHNDMLDTIVHAGLLGLAARLFFIVALLMVLMRAAVVRRPELAADDELIALALLAGITAHLAEIQVGIPTVATQLYFWMYAAIAVVVCTDRVHRTESGEGGDTDVILGFSVAVLLAVVVFGIYTPGTDLAASGVVIAAFLALVWSGAMAVVAASGAFASQRLVGVAGFALASLGGGLAFGLPYAVWLGWRPPRGGALMINDYVTHFVSVLYVGVFVLVLLGGLLPALLRRSQPLRVSSKPWLQAVVVPVVVVATGWIVAATNLAVSRADIYAKQGLSYAQKEDGERAATMYERALELQPWESRYALQRAQALSDAAVPSAGRGLAPSPAAVSEAERAALLAWDINPLETDNAALIARVNRRLLASSGGSADYRGNADRFYEQAVRLSPQRAALWNEYAGFLLEIGETTRALTAIDRALALDDLDISGHFLRAHACLLLERYQDALAAYDSVIALDPRLLAAWTGRSLALTRLSRPLEAIDANLRALELAPRDLIAHRNLATLYRDQRQIDAALEHSLAALEVAQGEDRGPLLQLVRQLEALRANQAPAQ